MQANRRDRAPCAWSPAPARNLSGDARSAWPVPLAPVYGRRSARPPDRSRLRWPVPRLPTYARCCCQVPQCTERKLVRHSSINCSPKQCASLLQIACFSQPAGDTRDLCAMLERQILWIFESQRDDAGQAGQRQDVDGVVMEHRQQTARPMSSQVFKVEVGNQRARNVTLALESEHLAFEIHQSGHDSWAQFCQGGSAPCRRSTCSIFPKGGRLRFRR